MPCAGQFRREDDGDVFMTGVRRLFLLAAYDPQGIVGEALVWYAGKLSECGDVVPPSIASKYDSLHWIAPARNSPSLTVLLAHE